MADKAKTNVRKDISVFIITGKDKFLIDNQCQELIDELVPPDERCTSLYNVEADRADIKDVLDELRTLPFLSGRRVVLIKDADKFISANRELLENYFERPSPTGVLIMTVQSWPKNTRLAKKLSKPGALMDAGQITHRQLPGYIREYARKKYDKSISANAAMLMIELVGDDVGRICSEIEKLTIYVGDKKNVETGDVEAIVGQNRLFNAFAVIESMSAGDISEAVRRLRNMFETDRNAEYTTVGAFAFHFRRLFQAKVLLQDGLARNLIMQQLGIWRDSDSFFRLLDSLTLKQIGAFLSRLAQIDHAAKTGRQKVAVAMEQLVVESGRMSRQMAPGR